MSEATSVDVNSLTDDEAKELYTILQARLEPRREYWVQDLANEEMHGNCQICSHNFDLKTAVWLHVGDRRYPGRPGGGALLLCGPHWQQAIRYVMTMDNFKKVFTAEPKI